MQSALFIAMVNERHEATYTLIEKAPGWSMLSCILLFALLLVPQIRKALSGRISILFNVLSFVMMFFIIGTFPFLGLTNNYLKPGTLYDNWELIMDDNGKWTNDTVCIHPIIWLSFSICVFATFVRFTLQEKVPAKPLQWIFHLLPFVISLGTLVYLLCIDKPVFNG